MGDVRVPTKHCLMVIHGLFPVAPGEHADAEAIKKVYKISGDELKTVRVRIPRAPSVLCTHTGNHLECILLKSDAPSAQGSLSDCAVCRIAVRDSL